MSLEKNLKNGVLNQSNRLFSLSNKYPEKNEMYLIAGQKEGGIIADLFKTISKEISQTLERKGISTQNFKWFTRP